MNFKRKIGLISLFLLLLPFVVPFSLYLLTMRSFGQGELVELEGLPGFVVEDVENILISKDPMNESVSEHILGLMMEEDGFIYISPQYKEFHDLPGEERKKKSITKLRELNGGSSIGISAFSVDDRNGLLFFKLPGKNPLKYLKEYHSLFFIFFLAVFIVIPVGLSTLFLTSLKRALSSLGDGARKISEGNLQFDIEIPNDRALGPVFSAFDNMRMQLIEDNAQKSRFLMATSHDLKTPLTSIKGYLEVLEDGLATNEEERQKYLKIIREKSNLLEERITQLVEFTRMETINWKTHFSPIDFYPFLKELMDIFKQESFVRGRQFSSTLDMDLSLIVMGDEQMLHRVFDNLMENAFRYTQKDDSISWQVKQEEDLLILSISDSGPGIEEDVMTKIFEPFYRGSKGRNEKGFGLGLTSVYSIIDAHGGSIDVRESSSGGAEFIIKLKTV